MTEEQRIEVAHACLYSSEKMIVIIHGTDTMCNTAKVEVDAPRGA
ncbi:MAG: hypothetical protein PHR69_00250 [Sphaerochaeta sp.]|nr:hypothetical protein [Sphaerochaeta sp.]